MIEETYRNGRLGIPVMCAGHELPQGPNGCVGVVKVATHSGTMLGLLIHGPGSWWLSGAVLPGAPGGCPTELGPSVEALVGRVAGAGAKY